jgi:uncharacterized protein DUF3159
MTLTAIDPDTATARGSHDHAVADDGGPATPPGRRPLVEAIGGRRGLLDGGLPALVFVAVHAVAGAQTTRSAALTAAIAAAATVGLAIVVLRLIRREPLRQALGGLAGLTIAVAFAATSGEARGFFLPGILVDAAYGVVFAGSALLGYPLVGTVYGLLYGERAWRADPRLRRLFVLATFGWSAVFLVRAGVQAFLYREDLPGLLAVGKLLLGWPLTLVAVALTLAAVRRATRRTASPARRAAGAAQTSEASTETDVRRRS